MSDTGPVTVTPMGKHETHLRSMTGTEELGRLYEYNLELLSPDADIALSEMLGQNMTVTVDLADHGKRYFNGIVTRFAVLGTEGDYCVYRATLNPWLWYLTRSATCRIFQNKKVPDIIKKVFSTYPADQVDEALGSYTEREYVVQYRETDFNFVSRLMEEEGIYYSFKHKDGKHILTLIDSLAGHEHITGYKEVPYYPPGSSSRRERDYIEGWRAWQQIQPESYRLNDYDFTNPTGDLVAVRQAEASGSKKAKPVLKGGVYDYPGSYLAQSEGERLVGIRLQELHARYETVEAYGTARGLGVGNLFKITGLPRSDENREYLVVRADYEIHSHDPESGEGAGEREIFRSSLTLIDAKTPFRPARVTRKPIVMGPQTAVVVGQKKADETKEEIWTDKWGRVLVRFHWEQDEENKDDSKPCWIRVAQVWAGSRFGGIHIPRIGQEVIVDFLEGDPDRPIITGRVYNKDNQPPYTLPGNQTQSGIMSRSTKKGDQTNFNELRFEDKKGEEELHIQAEKDMTTLVKNDQTTTVQKNRSASVGGNDSVSVTGDRSLTVHGNMSVTVEGTGKSPTHSNMTVTGKHNLSASDTIDMDAPTHIKLVCGGSSITIEPGKITLQAGGNAVVVLDANVLAQSSAGSKVVLDANAYTEASGGASVLLDPNVLAASSGGSQVLLDGSATMSTPGDATIDGMTATASGKTQAVLACGASSVTATPAGVDTAGPVVNVNGTATVGVMAPIVKVG